MESAPPQRHRDTRPWRRYLPWLGLALLLATLPWLCQPSATESVRAGVTASVAEHLGARAELVELEWLQARPSEHGVDFEARARVSTSQPGDLHAKHYAVHGSARATGDDDFQVQEIQVIRVPDVPPEPRP
jgi:hypothetical protein